MPKRLTATGLRLPSQHAPALAAAMNIKLRTHSVVLSQTKDLRREE